MQFRSLFVFAAALLSATPLLVGGVSTEKVFAVTGIIRAPLENGRIVIAHDQIPDYMPAMTMRFEVSDSTEAATLKPGDRVQFRLHVSDSSSKAEDFMVLGHEAPILATGAPTPPSKTAATRERLHEGDTVPDFSLVSEHDQPLTAADLRGHLTLVTFIFTRCPIPEYCPAMAARFGQLQRAIASDEKLAGRVRLLSITLDPEFDRPAILKAYGEAMGADSSVWNFATGTKEEIGALTKTFSVYTERNGVTLDHTLCTALIDRDGRVKEIWRGNGWKVTEILAALAQ